MSGKHRPFPHTLATQFPNFALNIGSAPLSGLLTQCCFKSLSAEGMVLPATFPNSSTSSLLSQFPIRCLLPSNSVPQRRIEVLNYSRWRRQRKLIIGEWSRHSKLDFHRSRLPIVGERLKLASLNRRHSWRGKPFLDQVMAIPHVLIADKAEKMIGDTAAACGEVGFGWSRDSPKHVSERLMTSLVSNDRPNAGPSFIAFQELLPTLRRPVEDQRDGRGRAFVRGEIEQEPLAIGRHRVFLSKRARQGTAGNANRKEGRRSFGFQRLAIGRHLHRCGHHLAVQGLIEDFLAVLVPARLCAAVVGDLNSPPGPGNGRT